MFPSLRSSDLLDAVNRVDTDCAIITRGDMDHTAYLGNTREKIGWEKAHIFRPGQPAICADPIPPQTVVDHAKELGADLWLFGKDFNYSGDRLQWAYGDRKSNRLNSRPLCASRMPSSA